MSGGRLASMYKRASPWQLVLTGSLVLIAGLVCLHAMNKIFLGDRDVFALDAEQNPATWISSTLFATAGMATLLLSWVDKTSRYLWAALGVVVLAFSLDDAVELHEATEREAESLSRIVLQPLVAGFLAGILVLLGQRLPRPEKWLLRSAAGVAVVALAASLLNAYWSPPYGILVSVAMLEETAEMLFPSLIIAAAVALAARLLDVGVREVHGGRS